jgi:hypothetical protein
MLVPALLIIIFGISVSVLMFVSQARKQRRELSGLTEHFYAISAPSTDPPATTELSTEAITELIAALEALGYDLTCEKTPPDPSGRASLAIGGELIVRDRRRAGALSLRISHRDERMSGEIVSKDDGPEFYEEMARYAIAALARRIPELRYAHRGTPPAPASALASELPEKPLGMALL